jgi:hypothetical protein
MQWSSEHPHIARIVVQFGYGNTPLHEQAAPMTSPPMQIPPAQVPAVIAAESLPMPTTTAAAFDPGSPQ